jgi:cyclase
VADIDASALQREPNYELIASLAAECRMPLCYAGGVKTVHQFERIISCGVEKVAIGSAAIEDPELISAAANRVGNQSVVVVLDVKKTGLLGRYEVVTHNGSRRTGKDPAAFAKLVESLGVGEILVNSVDRDGSRQGYDFDLISRVRDSVTIPISVVGGAGELSDLAKVIGRFGPIGAAAGSLFVFKGRFRAVLIQYPSQDEHDEVCLTREIPP